MAFRSAQRESPIARTGGHVSLFARWLRRRSIGLRMQLGFLVQLLLLLAVAGLAAVRFIEHGQALERLSLESMQRLRLAADVNAYGNRAARQLLMVVTGAPEQRADASAGIEAANQGLDATLQELRSLLPEKERGRRLGALSTALASYQGAYADTLLMVRQADLAGIRHSIVNRTDPALGRLTEVTEMLLAEEQAEVAVATRIRLEGLRQDLWKLGTLCGLAVLAGTWFGRAVRRSVSIPLQQAEAVALRLADGDPSARVRPTGQDEVARVAHALDSLADAVLEREQRIRRLAETDAMTGLAQRSRFLHEVAEHLARQPHQAFALFCLDLERLKVINALVGFDAGDAAIRCCADRLALEDNAPLARLGGGSFGLLLPLHSGQPEAEALQQGQRMRQSLERPFNWEGQDLDLALSAGVALYPIHSDRSESLLRRAEQALFEAKRKKSGLSLYQSSIEQARQQDLTLASDLLIALEQGHLQAHWQPKVRVTLGGVECLGAEGLIRWYHPSRGCLAPSEFIPFAERTGRIRLLTRWMLQGAIALLADPAFDGLNLSVNLSTHDLGDANLDTQLAQWLQASRVDPVRLTLEITESGLMDRSDDPIALLYRFKRIGVRLAIDDFGTGHSSLAYLQRLPVDELKIDRSFVRDVDLEPRRFELLNTIVQLGKSLGLVVTAEGVEREGELSAIRRVGCELVQGFYTGRPMPQDEFVRWIEKRRP